MPRSRSSFDAALRQLLQEGPLETFRSCGIPLPARLLPTEFGDARKLRPDYLALSKAGQPVHIEFQARNERGIADRLLEYRCPIKRFTGKAPLQFVLYGGKAPLTMTGVLHEPGLDYEVPIIDVRSLDPNVLMNSPLLADNCISMLCSPRLEPVAEEIVRRTGKMKRGVEPMLDLLLVLFVLRGYSKEEALEVLNNMAEVLDLMKMPKLKKSVDLVLERGREEGREQGREQGREAELAESRRSLLTMLESRFGHVPRQVAREIRKAGSKELIEYSTRLFQAQTPADVIR